MLALDLKQDREEQLKYGTVEISTTEVSKSERGDDTSRARTERSYPRERGGI